MSSLEKKFPAAGRLEELRLSRGLTQKDFADALGISQQQVSLYKRSGGMVGLAVILRAVERFEVSQVWLTHGEGSMYNDRVAERAAEWGEPPEMYTTDPKRIELLRKVKRLLLVADAHTITALSFNVDEFMRRYEVDKDKDEDKEI